MTARLSRIKDHATLLRAFALVAKQFPNVRLELAGDGTLRPSLESLCQELQVGDRTTFLGDIRDVYGAMSGWDLFAYATTEREGLGNAVSEAWLLGCRVLSRMLAPEGICGNGSCVQLVLVPHANPVAMAGAIANLINDFSERRRLSSATARFASGRFGHRKFASDYCSFMQIPSIQVAT